jgi:beta-mannosidase
MKKILFAMVILQMILASCSKMEGNSVSRIELDRNWEFRESGKKEWFPATVPGCVHTDLMNNEIIDDPFYRLNEKGIQWIGEKDWEYRTTFSLSEKKYNSENLELVFNGLDTYAKVYLNEKLLAETDNMFRKWRVNAQPFAKTGENRIRIVFTSVFTENLPKYKNAPFRLMACDNNDQADVKINMYSRKAGFHFGWDWGPRLVTAGIWQSVILESWNDFRLDNVHVVQDDISKELAKCTAVFEIIANKNQSVELMVKNGEGKLCNIEKKLSKGKNLVQVNFEIENPKLWWTNGLGEQYLYNLTFIVATDKEKEEKTERIGIRKLEVVREKDEFGKSLYIKLNDVPVFMKGANYIPQDNFQSRVTLERYEHIIKSAADANMNMLRVWGGGIYESDTFYDLCDQYGLLVWQDMMFACGMYPADNKYLENVTIEIKENVKRLRNHPSIALYCGNNENEIGWYAWGWKEKYDEKTREIYEKNMNKLFRNVIPKAIKSVDSTTFYLPTSPITGYNGISCDNGDVHYWGVWHGKHPFTDFEKYVGRFLSEWGFQSFPDINTVKKFSCEEDWDLDSKVMLSHQRCMSDARKDKKYGNRLIKQYMKRWYKTPEDFESFLYVSHLLQAKAVKMAISAHRRNMPKCMGSLYWQINDCWPAASWSSIDYFGHWKAAHYAARDAYKEILINPVIKDGTVQVNLISDKLETQKANLILLLVDFEGKKLMEKSLNIEITANKSVVVYSETVKSLLSGADPVGVVLKLQVATVEKVLSSQLLYFKPEKDLVLQIPELKYSVKEKDTGEFEITLTTDKLAKNIYLTTEEKYLHLNDNYFDLLPGMLKTLTLKCDLTLKELENKLVIKSLIDSY